MNQAGPLPASSAGLSCRLQHGRRHLADAGQRAIPFDRLRATWMRVNVGHSRLLTAVITIAAGAPQARTRTPLSSCTDIQRVQGIFRSTDKGATWSRVSDDAHNYGGRTIRRLSWPIRASSDDLHGTNGRGIVYAICR